MNCLRILLFLFPVVAIAQVDSTRDANRENAAGLSNRSGKNSTAYYAAQYPTAVGLYSSGKYEEARRAFAELAALSVKLYGDISVEHRNVLKDLAFANLQLKRYNDVIQEWHEVMRLGAKLSGDQNDLLVWGEKIAINLGDNNYKDVAIRMLDYCIRWREKAGLMDEQYYYWSLRYTRDYRHSIGKDDSLHIYFEKMARVLPAKYSDAAFGLRDWASFTIGRKEYARFEPIERATQKYINDKIQLGQRDAGYAEGLITLGRMSAVQGQTERALKAYGDALVINETFRETDFTSYMRNLKLIVSLCNDKRVYSSGTESYFQKFLAAYPATSKNEDEYLVNLMEAVRYHSANGRTDDAIALVESALGYVEQHQGKQSQEFKLFDAFLRNLKSPESGLSKKDQVTMSAALGLKEMEDSVDKLGEALSKQQYKTAVQLFEKSSDMIGRYMLQQKRFGNYVTMLCGMSYCYRQIGNLTKGFQLLQEASKITKEHLGDDVTTQVMVLVYEGEFYQGIGNDQSAEGKYLDVMSLLNKTQTKENQESNDEQYYGVVSKLGSVYRHWGYPEDALRQFEQVTRYQSRKNGWASLGYAFAAIDEADVLQALHERGRAAYLYNQAIPIIQKKSAAGAAQQKALSQYANFLSADKKHSEAIPLLLNARNYYEQTSGNKSSGYLSATSDLAMEHLFAGDYTAARPLFHELLQHQLYQVQNFFPALSESDKSLFYRRVYADLNAYNAFAIRDGKVNPEEIGQMLDVQLMTKGLLFRSTQRVRDLVATNSDPVMRDLFKQWQSARDQLANAYQLSTQEKETMGIKEKELEQQAVRIERELSQRSELFANLAVSAPRWQDVQKKLNSNDAAVEIVKLIEPRYDDVFSFMGKGFKYDSLPNGEWVVYDIRSQRCPAAKAGLQVGDIILSMNGVVLKGRDGSELDRLTKQEQITLSVRSESGKIREVKLKSDSVFTRRMVRSVRYAAIILKSQGPPKLVVLENGDQLDNRYAPFYQNAIRQRLDDPYSWQQFWKPFENHLSGINRVYFSPDGAYNFLNPGTFFNTTSGKYLIDEVSFVFLNNTADLLQEKPALPIQKATLIGFPDYQHRSGRKGNRNFTSDVNYQAVTADTVASRFMQNGEVSELPGTKEEVNGILPLLKESGIEVTTWLNSAASEEQMKQMEAPGLLHIATHGFFLSEIPTADEGRGITGVTARKLSEHPLLRSGLLLTGAGETIAHGKSADEAEDGILTAWEVLNLQLNKTSLVVLSACETGLGQVQNGEGVYGLNRAFRAAGAQSVLMSLWKVDDQATQQLMKEFYRLWKAKGNPLPSFRSAQQKLKTQFGHPYYWGAFILSGQ
ncbi:MAG: CHAT domain-containing protein [Cyclobacteriaceae bacterium]